jgi:hypothetical protein
MHSRVCSILGGVEERARSAAPEEVVPGCSGSSLSAYYQTMTGNGGGDTNAVTKLCPHTSFLFSSFLCVPLAATCVC